MVKGICKSVFKTLLKKLNFESTSDINGNYGPQTIPHACLNSWKHRGKLLMSWQMVSWGISSHIWNKRHRFSPSDGTRLYLRLSRSSKSQRCFVGFSSNKHGGQSTVSIPSFSRNCLHTLGIWGWALFCTRRNPGATAPAQSARWIKGVQLLSKLWLGEVCVSLHGYGSPHHHWPTTKLDMLNNATGRLMFSTDSPHPWMSFMSFMALSSSPGLTACLLDSPSSWDTGNLFAMPRIEVPSWRTRTARPTSVGSLYLCYQYWHWP